MLLWTWCKLQKVFSYIGILEFEEYYSHINTSHFGARRRLRGQQLGVCVHLTGFTNTRGHRTAHATSKRSAICGVGSLAPSYNALRWFDRIFSMSTRCSRTVGWPSPARGRTRLRWSRGTRRSCRWRWWFCSDSPPGSCSGLAYCPNSTECWCSRGTVPVKADSGRSAFCCPHSTSKVLFLFEKRFARVSFVFSRKTA